VPDEVPDLASAVRKTFKCLEALARAPNGLNVSEVAITAGFSRPAATRLLESLLDDGIVVKDALTKRYRLGLRLYEWSNVAVQATTPINIVRKEFIRLSMETGRECNILMLEDLDVVFLERCEVVDGVPLNRPSVGRRIWFETASGKAILAFSPPAVRKSVLERTAKLSDPPSPDQSSLERELEGVREKGYAVSTGPVRRDGTLGLGVPILGQSGYAVAAVGSFVPADELDRPAGATLVSQLMSAAARVSHYLGYETGIAATVS
jgi:IclR family transcriptional regulator, KDG regulon repressor